MNDNMNEPEKWINAYLDQQLSDEQFAKFEDWLRADEKNRELFVHWAFDDRAVYDQLAGQETGGRGRESAKRKAESRKPKQQFHHSSLRVHHFKAGIAI